MYSNISEAWNISRKKKPNDSMDFLFKSDLESKKKSDDVYYHLLHCKECNKILDKIIQYKIDQNMVKSDQTSLIISKSVKDIAIIIIVGIFVLLIVLLLIKAIK